MLYILVMAIIQEAIQAADANSGWVAYRPTMLVLQVSRGGGVRKFTGRRWYPWQPTMRDLMAQDWRYGLLENVMAELVSIANGEPEAES